MKMPALLCLAALLAASAAATSLRAADNPPPDSPKGLQAISKPSKDIVLSFVRPGRIVEMLVSKGDEVTQDQIIARQDDAEERAALAQDKLQADDVTRLNAEQTIYKQKVKDAEKMQRFSSSQFEIDNSILEREIQAAKIKIAENDHAQAMLKYQQTSIAVEKLTLRAPITGTIAEEFLKAGESADGGNMKAVRIVQLDPLWAEVPVPFLQARRLNKGDTALVTFTDGKERAGKVVVVSPVGDSASETILVRIAIPNPEKIPSGENVFVQFPTSAVAGARP
jgi:multidrug efflux pump subunit AcrA (membrane-fusion protein)